MDKSRSILNVAAFLGPILVLGLLVLKSGGEPERTAPSPASVLRRPAPGKGGGARPILQTIPVQGEVDLEKHLHDSDWTAFSFTGNGSPLAVSVDRRLRRNVRKRNDLVVRFIYVGAAGSPICKQFGITEVPTVWLYKGRKRLKLNTGAAMSLLKSQGR